LGREVDAVNLGADGAGEQPHAERWTGAAHAVIMDHFSNGKGSQTMSGKTSRARPAPAAKAEADARNVFEHGLPLLLGVRALEVSAERVTAEMPVKREHFNRNGRVGGGVLMAMADAMGAAGSVMHRPDGYRGGTLESKTNFFSAAR